MTPVQLPEVPAPVAMYTDPVSPSIDPQLMLINDGPPLGSFLHTASTMQAYATEAVMAERARLFAIGDDPRVYVDTFHAVVDSARSHIGARRPDDEDPEDQWMWDKLTALMEILTQPEQNSGR